MPPPASVVLAKKKKVIRAATRRFLDHGYDKMVLDDLIAEVGGSKAFIYNNFGGKKQLFEASIENACNEILKPLAHVDVSAATLKEGLEMLAAGFLKVSLANKSIALHRLIIAERPRFPHLGEVFLQAGPTRSYQKVADFLERFQQSGELKPGDAYDLAVQFLGMVNAGYLLKTLSAGHALPDPATMAARVKCAVGIFLAGQAVKA